MYARIQKWGNSQAIRLPKGLLEVVAWHENDQVEINAEKDCLVIRRIQKRHRTIEERLAGFSGNYEGAEWDTGKAQGNEVW
jgi:antitoxin MazE